MPLRRATRPQAISAPQPLLPPSGQTHREFSSLRTSMAMGCSESMRRSMQQSAEESPSSYILETCSTGLGTDAAKSPSCESVALHRHTKPCSLNSFDLDISNNVLYIGPYKPIGLYVWSLVNEIECVRCSAPRRQAVADQIRQRPGNRPAKAWAHNPRRLRAHGRCQEYLPPRREGRPQSRPWRVCDGAFRLGLWRSSWRSYRREPRRYRPSAR